MNAIDPRTPVLVGVGQAVDHWDGSDPAAAPDPVGLRAIAGRAALADSGVAVALAATIDQIFVIRTMADSVPGVPHPFGRCANPPGTLAADLGLAPSRMVYSVVGGDQPQALVNEAAAAIFAGEAKAVLIAGSEATAAQKLALRRGITLDWSRSAGGDFEDRGYGKQLLSPYELANGLGAPTQTYPAFEHALRARWGMSRRDYAALMAELWAAFSHVAAANRYSQFRAERTPDFLMTPSAENYPVADPYLKWHVAQDAVNQGAAVIMTSVAEADRLGIAPGKRVYLHGHAEAADRVPTERPDLSRSRAMELVLAQALATSGKKIDEIEHIDLYSCFPCAVLIAAEALGFDWRSKVATVTGGLPFFGGPGNSYSLHAIATLVERLREQPASFGLILANGGFLSKEAAGVYSTSPPLDWRPQSSAAIAQQIAADPMPQLIEGPCSATIETYTVTFAKGAPARAYVIAQTVEGARVLARTQRDDAATFAALLQQDPIGAPVEIDREGEVNMIDRIGGAA